MNHEAVHIAAPATPGLLNTSQCHFYILCSNHVLLTAEIYSTIEIIQNKLPQLEKTSGPKQPYLTKHKKMLCSVLSSKEICSAPNLCTVCSAVGMQCSDR